MSIEERLAQVEQYNRELNADISRADTRRYVFQHKMIRLSKKYTRLRKAVLPILACAYTDQDGLIKLLDEETI